MGVVGGMIVAVVVGAGVVLGDKEDEDEEDGGEVGTARRHVSLTYQSGVHCTFADELGARLEQRMHTGPEGEVA